MNRTAQVTKSKVLVPSDTHHDHLNELVSKTRLSSRVVDQPYATFAPIHYEPGYAYPLIVWLHDSGSNEHELRQVMPLVSMRNYVAIAPRGTIGEGRGNSRYGWLQSGDAIEAAHARIADCIDVAKERFNVHADRIFLVGRGTGGTMAVRTAWNAPDRFAGVVTMNGPLPTQLSPMRRVNELRRVPCMLTTSRESQIYPADVACRDLRLLHVAGCTVAMRQYPGDGDLTNNMLSDLDHWLMGQVCQR